MYNIYVCEISIRGQIYNWFCKVNIKKCKLKNTCFRFLSKEDKAVINFAKICEKDNYKWYVEVENMTNGKK